MFSARLKLLALIAVLTGVGCQSVWAGDLKVTLPRRSTLTPVQRLNREGVEAVQKQHYDKAEAIFYKAYLYDPSDPFTLNNLGYIAELQGQLDRAEKFYQLASEQGGDAFIDRSNAKDLEGKPMKYALSGLKDTPMRVNRMNVEAIQLLSEDRSFEADSLLQQALALDPQNTFTLNNAGVAKEALGDYEDALKYYHEAANSYSKEPVVITLKHEWRGKPVSDMAADSARQLEKRMRNVDAVEARAAMLTLRGVSATNRNDWQTAKQDFLQAYSLDPQSGFALNNYGYVAEKEGDLETAQAFYAQARKAADANARVGLATQRSEEGKRLFAVAADSDQRVNGKIDENSEARRREGAPVQLKRRNGTPVTDQKAAPAQPSPMNAPQPSSSPAVPNLPQ